jgi:hypothetical protein
VNRDVFETWVEKVLAPERTIDGFWAAIGRHLEAFTPAECANYFAAAG